jgi:26S proteasome regulatory subunit N7
MTAPAENLAQRIPNFVLSDQRYLLSTPDEVCPKAEKEAVKKEMLAAIEKDAMLPFYLRCCEELKWPKDAVLVTALEARNKETVAKIDAKIEDAKENLGDSEVLDGLKEKAEHFARIGDKTLALEAYATAAEKTVGVGGRLDNQLARIRVCFFHDDLDLANEYIGKAEVELAKGAEWERRNKLKVYKGLYLMLRREFKQAATMFLEAVATFTATEVVTFPQFIMYTVLTSMTSLDRKINKEQVVDCPEVLMAVHETPHLKEFMNGLVSCRYGEFYKTFPGVMDQVLRDRRMSTQYRYVMRHLRLNSYKQFLTSYKSVTTKAMADAFGVSPEFIDRETAQFIASGQIACKIDKVNGIIESAVPDSRNESYVQVIKQGDVLLARMQALSKVIDM